MISIKYIYNYSKILSEYLIEELLEKRDFYLYTIKHLEFKSFDDENPDETRKLMEITINELKKLEIEIQNLMNENS